MITTYTGVPPASVTSPMTDDEAIRIVSNYLGSYEPLAVVAEIYRADGCRAGVNGLYHMCRERLALADR